MLTRTALFLTALLVCGSAAHAQDHLVSADLAEARLQARSEAREADLSRVEALLASPRAARTASSMGVDIREVRSAARTLSDAELKDLAARATALEQDPSAGLSRDVDELLVVFLIVAIVVLVLKAV